jgi:hypothetical protein
MEDVVSFLVGDLRPEQVNIHFSVSLSVLIERTGVADNQSTAHSAMGNHDRGFSFFSVILCF